MQFSLSLVSLDATSLHTCWLQNKTKQRWNGNSEYVCFALFHGCKVIVLTGLMQRKAASVALFNELKVAGSTRAACKTSHLLCWIQSRNEPLDISKAQTECYSRRLRSSSFFLWTLVGLFMAWRRSSNSAHHSLHAPTRSSTSLEREPFINIHVTADKRVRWATTKNTVSFNTKLMSETKPKPTTKSADTPQPKRPAHASSASFSHPRTPPLSGASLHLNSRVASLRLRGGGDAIIHQPDAIGRSLFWARWTRHIHHVLVGSKPSDFRSRHRVPRALFSLLFYGKWPRTCLIALDSNASDQ